MNNNSKKIGKKQVKTGYFLSIFEAKMLGFGIFLQAHA
jgi:hypothetical protein